MTVRGFVADLFRSVLTKFRHTRAEDAPTLEALIVITKQLIAEGGLDVQADWVEHWLSRGKTPEQVREIALGTISNPTIRSEP